MSDNLHAPGDVVQGATGSYRIEAFLGRGGFGETYRARNGAGGDVTIKVLRVDRLESWKALELFEREARALADLDHPRLPRLIEVFVTDGRTPRALGGGERVSSALAGGGRVVLVQTFIAGRTLQAAVDGGVPLDATSAERVARDLLDILTYLHGRDPPIIHRDLKPSNVIVDGEGRAYLIDFGAIQLRTGEGGSTMIGTMGYFPPEQLLGRAVAASDLYALGMTLIVGLTGRPPEAQPSDPRTGGVVLPIGLPLPLARFLHELVRMAPGDRPQTAAAARELLDGKLAIAQLRGVAPVAKDIGPVLSSGAVRAHKAAFNIALVGGLAAAGYINILAFNHMSETRLVQLAPFWLAPILFGGAGLFSLPRRSSVVRAVAATGIGLVLLFLFLYGIFPSL